MNTPSNPNGAATLLSIQDLRVAFRMGSEGGVTRRVEAVRGVRFDIPENTTVALVGESGSGKSVTAMSIVNLLPDNAERTGAITFEGRDLLAAPRDQLQAMRGREIACVFQDPMSSLNPVFTVGEQIGEPLRKHLGLGRREAILRAEALLVEVGMPEPKRRLAAYPHQSFRRSAAARVIAMALACEPQAAHRRRADDGTRRHHSAPDPRAARAPEGKASHEHALHQPRPRRGRRDRRPRRGHAQRHRPRAGAGRAHLRDAAGQLHEGAARLPADAGPAGAAPDGGRRPHRGPRRCRSGPPRLRARVSSKSSR